MNIAIVTVTLNDKRNLLRTFESIRKYKKVYHSYYVIDGNSKDGTIDEIKKYLDIIDSYISEPDSGIYDAMNKALNFEFDDSDFILWLNAGDELIDWKGININELNDYDCAFYSVLTKMDVSENPVLNIPKIKLPYNVKNFYPNSIYMHQGFLIRRDVFESLKYNTKIGLQAENLLMSQCILRNSFSVSSNPISVFYLDGISNRQFKRVYESYLRVAKTLGFNLIELYYYHKFATIKYLIRRLFPLYFITSYSKLIRRKKSKKLAVEND